MADLFAASSTGPLSNDALSDLLAAVSFALFGITMSLNGYVLASGASCVLLVILGCKHASSLVNELVDSNRFAYSLLMLSVGAVGLADLFF